MAYAVFFVGKNGTLYFPTERTSVLFFISIGVG
jgi:hypothetical protein